jgi:hypothetical protein
MKPFSIIPRRAQEKWQIDPALAVSLLRDIALIHAQQAKVVAIRNVNHSNALGKINES